MKRQIALGKVARTLAPGHLEDFASLVPCVAPEPLEVRAVYEMILQSYLFFGYAQSIEALKVFTDALEATGLQFTFPPLENLSQEEYGKRGEGLCRRIYAPNYERLMENMKSVSPEIASWMVVEGYGKVLSRQGLSEVERELISIVFLTCSNHPVQIYSHVRGARNLGCARVDLLNLASETDFSPRQRETLTNIIDKVYSK